MLGAIKLTGTVRGASVGLLSAIEPRLTAQVLEPPARDASGQIAGPGRLVDLRSVEARSTSVGRVRVPLGDNGVAGVAATAVDPLFAGPSLGLDHRHAHVGAADLTLYTGDRVWQTGFQAVGSHLTGKQPDMLLDGTLRGPTSSGFATSAKIRHSSEHLIFGVQGDLLSPAGPRAALIRASSG